MELVWDPLSAQQSQTLTTLCKRIQDDYSVFDGEQSKPVKVFSFDVLTCNFMAVISVNIIRLWFHPAGLCRSSYSEVKERSRQWCLCTTVPKKVSFIWICVGFNILINISKTLCVLCWIVCDCNELIKTLCFLLRFLEDKRSPQFQFQNKQLWSAVKVWHFTSGHVVTVNIPLLFPSIFQMFWVSEFF